MPPPMDIMIARKNIRVILNSGDRIISLRLYDFTGPNPVGRSYKLMHNYFNTVITHI
jgi:hypothetical protein